MKVSDTVLKILVSIGAAFLLLLWLLIDEGVIG